MTNNITPLIFKLLASEQLLNRIEISSQILSVLQTAEYSDAIESAMREHLITRIKACALNPSSRHRQALIDIMNFYVTSYADADEEYPVAA